MARRRGAEGGNGPSVAGCIVVEVLSDEADVYADEIGGQICLKRKLIRQETPDEISAVAWVSESCYQYPRRV